MINETEPKIVAKYLGIKHPNPALYQEYNLGIQSLNLILILKEIKVMNRLLKFPFLLPFADGGYALLKPNHSIRKRLLLMSALIETDKKYVDHFIPESNISLAVLRFLYRGSVGMIKGCIGAMMLILFRWN